MRRHAILIIAALVLAFGSLGPDATAQSNDESSRDDAEDYANDPSYQAARRVLEVFAGAADKRAKDAQRAEDRDDTLTTDPWPEGSAIDAWEHHYFIFQGENYFPVVDSYVTPFVTLFKLENGYMPIGDENKNCAQGISGHPVEDGANAEIGATAKAAVATDAAGVLADARRYGCPRTLGQLWGSGSQVMDKDHTPLGEQWFPDGTKAIVAGDFPLHDEGRFEESDGNDVLVVFGGGPDRLGDPAIHPLPVAKMIIVDYPVLRREGGKKGGSKQDDGTPKQPYIPGAPELPVNVSYRLGPNTEESEIVDGPAHTSIDLISERLAETIDRFIAAHTTEVDFLLVHRAAPDVSVQIARDRLRIIRETLNPYGNVEIVSFGQEMPICQSSDDHCWSINRSTILYVIER